MNDGIEASQSTARKNPRGFKCWRTKLQTFAALHADADVRSFLAFFHTTSTFMKLRLHKQSTIMKLKPINKVASDTIGPARVSIQHAISLDVRGDAKDLLCAGACTRGVPTLNQEYSCKWHKAVALQ